MANQELSISRGRSRRRRIVGAAASVRDIGQARRRMVKASRRTYFALYAPRFATADWRASRPKFLAAALAIVLVIVLYHLFTNEAFFVAGLKLGGNRLLPPSEIEQAAGIHGWNVFFIDPGEVEAALEKLPEVKDAHVTLNLPGQAQVQVVERLPRFVWETSGGTCWVDDDGIALRARGNAPDLLTMKDADSAAIKVGERVNPEAFNAAVSLRNAWRGGPGAFEWSKAHGLAIRDEHGWLIYFGSAGQMADKLAALKIVTAQLVKEQRVIAFIDLGSGLPYYQEVATKQ
jgi:hypothetical protein